MNATQFDEIATGRARLRAWQSFSLSPILRKNPLYLYWQQKCEQLGVSYRYKDVSIEQLNLTREKPMSLGRTELGRLIEASAGEIRGTTLQLPTSSYHTQLETGKLSSVHAMIRLLSSLSDPVS